MQDKKQLPSFADVALPIPLRKTFLYRLPIAFRNVIKLGARLLVPFGNRSLTGYVVALHTHLDEVSDLPEENIKDALELIDEDPLINDEILRLTKWASEYYLTSWGELLKASLPAGINSRLEQYARITPEGADEILKLSEDKLLRTVKAKILKVLSEKDVISVSEIQKMFNRNSVRKALKELNERKWISIFNRVVTARTKAKFRKTVQLVDLNCEETELTSVQRKVISLLLSVGGQMYYTDLLEMAEISSSVIRTLESKGIVQIVVQEIFRNPLNTNKTINFQDVSLTEDQQNILNKIKTTLQSGTYKTFLLHGVTGSGKTAVYIQSVKEALKLGKSSLILVPEISLTSFFSHRLVSAFGSQVAVLHSSLSAGERFDEWRRIKSGEAKVVIGTRSAIFAPLESLGLIIVDEEHDSSYRQQETPPYNARDLAVVRAKLANAVVVLGSATPSLESFYNAKTKKYGYLHLPNRIKKRSLPSVEIVDMRNVFAKEGRVVISKKLLEAIEETAHRNEQSIILLNRRGFSQFVLCSYCGETIRCKNCDITLTYHKNRNLLLCHYCNFQLPKPMNCPFCRSENLSFIGEGTEKVEELIRKSFPKLRIARLDRDNVQKRNELETILRDFSEGKIDMLVGTQMISKGHDFPNVTLVGVISVDNILALPDFRASEKAFQLLTQVAGRSGRGEKKGHVLIQTFHPEHYAIQYASRQNYEEFYHKEAEFRRKLSYPPFAALACVLIQHQDYRHAVSTALAFKTFLQEANVRGQVNIMEISQAPIARIKGKHRLQILVKSQNRRVLHEVLELALIQAEEQNCDLHSINVEVDPASLI